MVSSEWVRLGLCKTFDVILAVYFETGCFACFALDWKEGWMTTRYPHLSISTGGKSERCLSFSWSWPLYQTKTGSILSSFSSLCILFFPREEDLRSEIRIEISSGVPDTTTFFGMHRRGLEACGSSWTLIFPWGPVTCKVLMALDGSLTVCKWRVCTTPLWLYRSDRFLWSERIWTVCVLRGVLFTRLCSPSWWFYGSFFRLQFFVVGERHGPVTMRRFSEEFSSL